MNLTTIIISLFLPYGDPLPVPVTAAGVGGVGADTKDAVGDAAPILVELGTEM